MIRIVLDRFTCSPAMRPARSWCYLRPDDGAVGRPRRSGINLPAGDDFFVSWCMAAIAFLGLATVPVGERSGSATHRPSRGQDAPLIEVAALIIGTGIGASRLAWPWP